MSRLILLCKNIKQDETEMDYRTRKVSRGYSRNALAKDEEGNMAFGSFGCTYYCAQFTFDLPSLCRFPARFARVRIE